MFKKMKDEKIDLTNRVDVKDKAMQALERAKAMERNYKGETYTTTLPNGTEIRTTNKERLNEYIADYGKL